MRGCWSFVAGQAIAGSSALLVTRQAPAHFIGCRAWRTGHTRHLAMTRGAFESMGEMTFMGEIDKIRQTLQSHPLNRFLAFPMVNQRLYSGCSGIEVLVTAHAKLQTRNTGSRRAMRGPVAESAVQCEVAGVEGMVEVNRLLVVSRGVCTPFRVQNANDQGADSRQRY